MDENEVIADLKANRDVNSAKLNVSNYAQENPDTYAHMLQVSREIGVPVDTVIGMPGEAKTQAKMQSTNWDSLAKVAPATAKILANEVTARVAHDDIDNMSAVESVLNWFKGSALASIPGMGAKAAGVLRAGTDVISETVTGPLADYGVLPVDIAQPVSNMFGHIAQSGQAWVDYLKPQTGDTYTDAVRSGITSFGSNALLMPMAGVGFSENAYLSTMSALSGGQSYQQYKEGGLSTGRALLAAGGDAVVEGVTEKAGVDALFKHLKIGDSWVKSLIAQAFPDQVGEQVATIVQDYNQQIQLHPEKSFSDYLKERPEAALQTAIATAVGQGGMVTLGKMVDAIAQTEQQKVKQANDSALKLQELDKAVKALNILQRDPVTTQAFLDAATKDGPTENVFIDAKALYQSGLADAAAQISPAIQEQLPMALETYGMLQIPTSEYMTKIAPSEIGAQLLDHIKFNPEDFTRAEAEEYTKQYGEQQQQEVEHALQQAQADDVFKADANDLVGKIQSQLNATGYNTKAFFNGKPENANAHYATLFGNFYAVTAAKMGMTPNELYEKYPIDFSRSRVDGGVLNQGKPFDESRLVEFDKFKTGQSVTFDFIHNTESATKIFGKPKKDAPYGRGIEPSGRYVNEGTLTDSSNPKMISGQLTFNNPLVLNTDTWKQDLFDHYKKRGKALSKALIADGYDGVVTINKDDRPGRSYASEILDLTTFDESKALYQSTPDLMATHNLSEKNLLHAQKMGGIPVPSLAVTKKQSPLTGFGEITLMASKEMVDPKGYAKTQVFGADIYSPRYPSVSYFVDRKIKQATEKYLAKAEEETGQAFDWDDFERNGSKWLDDSLPLMWQFLHEKGIEPAKVMEKGADPLPSELSQWENWDGIRSDLMNDPQFYEAAKSYWRNILTDIYKGDSALADEEIEQEIAQANDESNNVEYPGFLYISFKIIDEHRYQKRKRSGVDTYETKKAIRQQIEEGGLKDEFSDFIERFTESLSAEEKIFKGYTNSGNRTYTPHTLENVVKILKKELRGGENFNYGVGTIRAKFTPKFKSVAEIQKNKNRLLGSGEFDAVKKEIDSDFDQLQSDLRNYHSYSNNFGFGDTVTQTAYDVATMGIPRALKENGFEDVPEDVQKSFAEFLGKLRDLPTEYFEAKILRDVGIAEFSGAVVPSDISQKALDALKAQGITDIKTYQRWNEDDRAAKIQEFQHLFFQKKNGAFDPESLTIHLFKSNNLSTVLHEAGHFFLHVQFDLASKLERIANEHGIEELSQGERELLADTQRVLEWFGVPDLQTWFSLDFEQQRPYHEKFATGFETYLFKGNAPSIELQSVFQRFASWLLGVYKSIKGMTEISPEIAGVFDRMLATREQIQLAQMSRSMIPLFTREDAEAVGLTPEWFDEYQKLYIGESQEAIEEMRAKAMRDMAYSRNAHGRMFKKLQQQATELRREVRKDVRDKVMSLPVYRAWTFLTNKVGDESKLPNEPKKTSNPDVVDAKVDSLAVAIAKFGGLNKKEVVEEWGVDPAHNERPVFGKPLLRSKGGGLTIEAMAEKLSEEGYLSTDKDGRYDLREFEEKLDDQLRGKDVYSVAYVPSSEIMPGSQAANPDIIIAGRLDEVSLLEMEVTQEQMALLKARKFVKAKGLHPEIVADLLGGFESAEDMIQQLLAADDPKEVIERMTDEAMLQQHGELATPAAIARSADQAIYNDVRARMLAHEINGINKATGEKRVLIPLLKDFARQVIEATKIRNLRPGMYSVAAVKAGKEAKKAHEKGEVKIAVAEKRNQLINELAAKETYAAQDDVKSLINYLKRFDKVVPSIDAEYRDQIDQLLERFEFKQVSLKELGRRESLQNFIERMANDGLDPEIPAYLTDSIDKINYKDMTVAELRALADAVKTIEHLGRLKNKLMLASRQQDLNKARDEITNAIITYFKGTKPENRTVATWGDEKVSGLNKFIMAHFKAANLAREMDGFKDGGVVWDYIIRPSNERSNYESTKIADVTQKLHDIMKPVLAQKGFRKKLDTKKLLRRQLTKEQLFCAALNTGNEGNMQRLLSGDSWDILKLSQVFKEHMTATDWQAVQKIWDLFEELKPEVAALDRRTKGFEPEWVQRKPFTVMAKDDAGDLVKVALQGGYYPIKYDREGSAIGEKQDALQAAQDALSAVKGRPTTNKSHTKQRASEVTGAPLLLTLTGMYSSFGNVIHDLSWREFLIDMNRLFRGQVSDAMREYYGAATLDQFKTWRDDIAVGSNKIQGPVEKAISTIRRYTSASTMGYNLMTAAKQPLGLTQSFVRVGYKPMADGLAKFMADPKGALKAVNAQSEFMRNRSRTRFRELNEIRNQVNAESGVMTAIHENAYYVIMRMQQLVDYPTWLGAYNKALEEYPDNDDKCVAMADQAVIDSQGGGEIKDRSAIERDRFASIFGVYYTYMNTALNLNREIVKSNRSAGRKAADLLMIDLVPVMLGYAMTQALAAGSGDDDWDEIVRNLIREEISFMMGMVLVVREAAGAFQTLAGGRSMDYTGPGGLKTLVDFGKLTSQAVQLEFDDGFRKAMINMLGDVTGIPSSQINRTITGTKAIAEGDTQNPMAIGFGFKP